MIIRKQDYDLSVDDLIRYPAWEYALDEEAVHERDERTVRPYLQLAPLDPHYAYFIVRASFFLVNGMALKGYITPIKLGKYEFMKPLIPYDLGPVILTERGRVIFGYGYKKPNSESIARNYKILGQPPAEVFPIKFASDVEIANGISEGILEGFLYFEGTKKAVSLSETDIKFAR
jgi:hypothetical protein